MGEIWELVLFIFGILLSGFYSGSEATIIVIGVERARQLIEMGGRRKEALLFLTNNQNNVLTTILIGNNVVNIFTASLVTNVAHRYFKSDIIAISTGITTLLILIFGEIIPKTFARSKAEKLVYPVIKILQFNYYLMYPLVRIFTFMIDRVLGKNAELRPRLITKNDIEFMVNKAEQEKTIDSKQLDLLTSILEFPTIKVKDIMVPRTKIAFVKSNQSYQETSKLLANDIYSRYPVCNGDLDKTIGLLHVKDIAFLDGRRQENFDIQKYMKKPFFVYEHMKIQSVFDHMNKRKIHMGLVKDENGLVVGIITLEDIIEEIVGEIQDEHDQDVNLDRAKDKINIEGIFVNGSISLRDLYNEYDIKIPLNDNYSTLTGFILDNLGNNFPKKGQIIVWEGYSFKINSVKNFEITEIHITDVEGEKHIFSKKSALP